MNAAIIRDLLRKQSAGRSAIRATTMSSLLRNSGVDEFIIRSGLRLLVGSGEIAGQFDAYGYPIPGTSVRLTLKVAPLSAHAARFQETLATIADMSQVEHDGLINAVELLHDLSCDDLRMLLIGLRKVGAEEHRKSEPVFVVSARHLLGSSKILDYLPTATLKAFGIQRNSMHRLSPSVVIGGPEKPDAVVLIENPHAFETAVKSDAVTRVAFVCVHGYGLSLSGNAWGEQLATVLEQRQYISLTRCGRPPPLEVLLQHAQLYFWGDLDMASIDIFERIRQQFTQTRLSRLYRPLVALLKSPGKSHPYAIVTGKDGQQVPKTQDDVAAGLLQLCAFRAVDQESLSVEEINRYALEMLETGDL